MLPSSLTKQLTPTAVLVSPPVPLRAPSVAFASPRVRVCRLVSSPSPSSSPYRPVLLLRLRRLVRHSLLLLSLPPPFASTPNWRAQVGASEQCSSRVAEGGCGMLAVVAFSSSAPVRRWVQCYVLLLVLSRCEAGRCASGVSSRVQSAECGASLWSLFVLPTPAVVLRLRRRPRLRAGAGLSHLSMIHHSRLLPRPRHRHHRLHGDTTHRI